MSRSNARPLSTENILWQLHGKFTFCHIHDGNKMALYLYAMFKQYFANNFFMQVLKKYHVITNTNNYQLAILYIVLLITLTRVNDSVNDCNLYIY